MLPVIHEICENFLLCYTSYLVSYKILYMLQIVLLDQIPDVHMYVHLPEFLDGLITILGDNNKEIRKMYCLYIP